MNDKPSGKSTIYQLYRRYRYIVLGVVTMIVCWQVASMLISPVIIASPGATVVSLWNLVLTADLWEQLGISLVRMLLGILLGSAIGGVLGIVAAFNARWQAFLEPLRWGVMTMPSIMTLVLVLLLFGMGGEQAIVMTGFVTFPFAYISTQEGMKAGDRRLVEMAEVYRIPRRFRFSYIYLPGIGGSIMAGLTLTTGIGIRATILAEFLGARDGIGHKLFLSWTHLNTPELCSWIMLMFILLAVLEFGLLRPFRDFLLRWQRIR